MKNFTSRQRIVNVRLIFADPVPEMPQTRIPLQTDIQGYGDQHVPPPGKMRLVISPNGHWIGVCIACHKLLKQSLFPEKAVLSCPQCRCCITVKMDLILDHILSAKTKNERVVLLFNSIG